jgi:tight adherence protein B
MNVVLVCVLVGLAITINCLAAYWLLRRLSAWRDGVVKTGQPARAQTASASALPSKPRRGVRALYIQAGYQSSVLIVYGIIAGLLLFGLLVGKALRAPVLISLPVSLLISLTVPLMYLRMKGRARQRKFLDQLPNALELLANGLRAGLGINSALEIVAQEIPDPLGTEFSQMITAMNLGGASLDRALAQLIERNPSTDLRLFAQALLVNKQVGGNLAEVLDNLDRTIRERFWLQRELQSVTAEQRVSALILALLPVGMGLALTVMNPSYMSHLLTTVPGRLLLLVAGILEFIGWMMLRQILRSVVDF